MCVTATVLVHHDWFKLELAHRTYSGLTKLGGHQGRPKNIYVYIYIDTYIYIYMSTAFQGCTRSRTISLILGQYAKRFAEQAGRQHGDLLLV